MIETRPSRSGPLTATCDGRNLHSSIDPRKEAERFVEANIEGGRSTVVVIGPGLGYLCESILDRHPRSRVIAMHLAESTAAASVSARSAIWHPGMGAAGVFLSSVLDELDCVSLQVCEWPPVCECFPDEAARVRQAVSTISRRHVASLMTEGASGRRWLSNLCRNFVSLERAIVPAGSLDRPVKACFIAGAGPTLEASLDVVRRNRGDLAVWAVGSALQAVMDAGIEPDLVVTTDPAVYALEYLRSAIRGLHGRIPFAGPLTGARGFADVSPVWPLSSGDGIESSLWRRLDRVATEIPAHGTVTGTAFNLAMQREWPIVLAGFDFAWRDLRAHVRPHLSESYDLVACGRFRPRVSDLYARRIEHAHLSGEWTSGPDLRVYAEWFEQRAVGSGRVYRLNSSPAVSEIPEIDESTLRAFASAHRGPRFEKPSWPRAEERSTIAADFLASLESKLVEGRREDPLTVLIVRRLALDGLLRFTRSGDDAEWSAATSAAARIVAELRGAIA